MHHLRRGRAIYVESLVRADLDALWAATQEPDRHRRWDLRFGEISYLIAVDGEPQQFTYATTVAGIRVAGTGEALGDRHRPDGTRWSGLRFWTDDRRSVLRTGAGYWKYVPTDDGIRFLTRFDYRTRWGTAGVVLDRCGFRPAFGWATAWSFDRLRIWLEDGVPPERSARRYLLNRLGFAVAAAGTALVVLAPHPRHGRNRARIGRAPAAAVLVAGAATWAGTLRGLPSGRRPLRRAPDRQPPVGDLP